MYIYIYIYIYIIYIMYKNMCVCVHVCMHGFDISKCIHTMLDLFSFSASQFVLPENLTMQSGILRRLLHLKSDQT